MKRTAQKQCEYVMYTFYLM